MAEAAAPVKGTRPEGAVSESEASNKIREMFTLIAPRYDLLNHLLSFDLDRLWRARDVSRIVALIRRLGPLPPWPHVPPAVLLNAMRSDKKTRAGILRFVLSPRIGEARSYDTVPLHVVERVLHFTPRLVAVSTSLSGKHHG